MITAFVGNPGSGKSLHMAMCIVRDLAPKKDTYVITNIPLNNEIIPIESRERYRFVSNEELKDAQILVKIATEYWKNHVAYSTEDAENRIHLYIDECQYLFNAREWQKNKNWTMFFSVHRHYGFKVYLITQMLGSIDKQVRGVIEYYIQHRKVCNFGIIGSIIGFLTRNRLFVTVTMWAPLDERISSDFFMYKDKYGHIYNTHALFGLDGSTKEGVIRYEKKNKKNFFSFLDTKKNIKDKEVLLIDEKNTGDNGCVDA